MRHNMKPLMPQVPHQIDLILGHRAKRKIIRFGNRIAITAQVGHNNAVRLGQILCHHVPHHMRLRISMQQQQRWTIAAHTSVNGRIGHVHINLLKTRKHLHAPLLRTSPHLTSLCPAIYGPQGAECDGRHRRLMRFPPFTTVTIGYTRTNDAAEIESYA